MQLSRLLISVVLAAHILGCGEMGGGTGLISQKIGKITREPGAKEVDLAKLTTFGWAYFFFFKPGTSREDICKFIEAKRTTCGRVIRYEKVPSDHYALLFGLNGNLTHTELHALANGEFDFEMPQDGIDKSRSVFTIKRSSSTNGQDRIFLEPR